MLVTACGGGGAVLEGFERVEVAVGGEPWTVAVADDAVERALGLKGVTNLGDVDGMLFVHPEDSGSGFWMKDTLIPLDIAFFSSEGELIDLLQMEPCRADPCPAYRPVGPYRYALEAERGRFGEMGGISLRIVDPLP